MIVTCDCMRSLEIIWLINSWSMGKINPNMVPIMNLKNLINFEERYLM